MNVAQRGAGFVTQFLTLSVAVLSSAQGADTQKATSLCIVAPNSSKAG
jgi:hypothetical protein